jgi:L-threonylcarbamoyladenylate synthase
MRGGRLFAPTIKHKGRGGMNATLEQAVNAVLTGDVLVYPTETFFALGGDATSHQVARKVESLKLRPPGKPFPVLTGSWELTRAIVAEMTPLEERIARKFWPGPLSILLQAREGLPPHVRGADGTVCLRWTSHPVAGAISRESAKPLIATSANRSAEPPASRPWQLDKELLHEIRLVMDAKPWPSGGLPSTIIRCTGQAVEIVRAGAVSREALEGVGITIRGAVF